MEIISANLSVHYKGRGETFLSPYPRVLIIKSDGSVSIHSDSGHKPLNYMMATTERTKTTVDDETVWEFFGKKESLTVTFHEDFERLNLSLGTEDPGLQRLRTENHLQEWLSNNPELFGENITYVEREFPTGQGPIDLFFERSDHSILAVEVKRVADLNTVGQILRYQDALEERFPGRVITGIIAAVEFKKSVLKFAEKKGVSCLEVPKNWASLDDKSSPSHITLFDI